MMQHSAMAKALTIRPDAKGRITLGKLARGVSSFHATTDTKIPASEKWLFDNKPALAAVKEGLSQAAHGRVKPRGSFAKFANDKID
jgi:predicted transcriptional regulator